MSLREVLKGTGVAIVTPFNKNHEVDFDAYKKLVDFLLKGGVEYLVVLGSTGEAATLSQSEKIAIINYTFDIVPANVPIVVGVANNNTKELLNEIHQYPLDKAAAILSTSPWYNKPSQEGIYQHYKALASVAPKPIILYNVPGRTGSNISAQTTIRLANEIPNIGGIKEASGNMVQCMHILKNRPTDFLVVSGDDHLGLSLIAAGMDGVISVAANCFPKYFSQMVRMSLGNELDKARELLYKMLIGFDLLFEENNPAGVKAFLAEMGIIQNQLRLPLLPLRSDIHERVKVFIDDMNELA